MVQNISNTEYEELISNSENEIKNLLNFCDLDWEKSCLEFYKNKKVDLRFLMKRM